MKATVYVNWGRWLAKCPRCPNAEAAGDPVTGGLTGDRFRCSMCGLRCPADWPPSVDDIWRLLCQRPNPATRNWEPGESLMDLFADNVAHGIWPATPEVMAAQPGGLVLEVVDERIVGGLELPAAPLPAIGGR